MPYSIGKTHFIWTSSLVKGQYHFSFIFLFMVEAL
jgi:hypothetical protein